MKERMTLPVLVADDNPINAEMLTNFLNAKGFEVHSVRNGHEALIKTKQFRYGFIILDMLMPLKTGYDVLQELRTVDEDTPVIAHSSLDTKKDKERAFKLGCNDFIGKPISFIELEKIIEKYSFRFKNLPETKNIYEPDSDRYILSGLKILIVEEDKNQADELYDFLTAKNAIVKKVLNGKAAWDIIQKEHGDFYLVISNIYTSGIDGLGLMVKVKKKYSSIIFIMYTEFLKTEEFRLAVELGVDLIIPYSEIESSIESYIESILLKSGNENFFPIYNNTVEQVRESQLKLHRMGLFSETCFIDIAYLIKNDAGGDVAYFKEFKKGEESGIVLIDVAGHDVKSSYISAIFMGVLYSLWEKLKEPRYLLYEINRELYKIKNLDSHICMSVLLFNQRTKKVKLASAGNPGPIIITKKDNGKIKITEYEGGGMCVGMLDRTDLFVNIEIDIPSDSIMMLFSDGLTAEEISFVIKNKHSLMNFSDIRGFGNSIISEIKKNKNIDDDIVLLSVLSPALIKDIC